MNSMNSIVNQRDEAYERNYYAWNNLYPLADRDLRYYLNDQWSDEEKRILKENDRYLSVYNLIRPNINMVSGYQKKHRHSSIVVPTESMDQQSADQLTKLMLYAFQYGDGYDVISECFRGALITGWNLLSLWMDYRTDPVNGDIRFGRIPYNGFICDPYFTKKDFSDCSNIEMRSYVSLQQAKSLLPKYKKELDEILQVGWERDDKFTWLPYQQQPNGERMLAYDEYWVQGFDTKRIIYNVETGQSFDYDGDEKDFFLYADPNAQLIEVTEPYVLQHIIVNSQHIHTEKNPFGLNEYPFVPFFSIFEPESSDYSLKIQSLVRVMIDPQRDANKRRSQIIDIVESQLNSGWIADEDSCVNPRSLFKSSQGQVIWRKRGAALDKIPPSQVPPSFFQMVEMHDRDVMRVAGISEELLGQQDSQEDSGLKVMLRQSAALVGLQDLFDNLRFAQEVVSKKVLKLIQTWTPQKLSRILGEQPSKNISDRSTLKYDIAVQEGVLTNTQQQMFFRQLIELKELGEPVPPGLLARVAPLQGKTEYLQAMEEFQNQQQQAQQQAVQLEQEKLRIEGELIQSQSLSNVAMAKERFTRAVANMGLEDERASKAVNDRSSSTLNQAKALKELESMDDARLANLLEIVMKLNEFNRTREEITKRDDVTIAQTDQNFEASNEKQNVGLQQAQNVRGEVIQP